MKGTKSFDATIKESPARALFLAEQSKENAEGVLKAGIDPMLFFGQCSINQGKAGLCRHSAVAYAGLLRELGFPESNIRLVRGVHKDNGSKHMWVEVRAKNTGENWISIDPTPASGASQKEVNNNYLFGKDLIVIENPFTPQQRERPYYGN